MAHLLLAGGGHAHLMTLAGISAIIGQGHRVTVVAPSPFHYYSGMGPGMLGGTYSAAEIRFATQKVVEQQGGAFVLDRVTRIAAEAQTVLLASGREIAYDVLSCNTGSQVACDLSPPGAADVFPVKPIERLAEARDRVLALAAVRPLTIVIAGGGPSSAEIAGNLRQLTRRPGLHPLRIKIFAGHALMGRFPEAVRSRVIAGLGSRGIEIVNQRVTAIRPGEVVTADGATSADLVFLAPGVRPSPLFQDSNLALGSDGGLLVNRFLQAVDHPRIFGGGDCISFADQPLDKVGVYAVRQNPILRHNLEAALAGQPLLPFVPGGGYLLIFNLGEGHGVLHKGWLTMAGALAFRAKDLIDRRFMRRFQAMERG
jgi:NADH dehydrogenase FAD-containing subunit